MSNKDNEQSTGSKPQPAPPAAKPKAPLPQKGIPDFPGDGGTGSSTGH